MNHWLVIRTRIRWEKKVTAQLRQKGIDVFCPTQKARRQWSDRIKMVEAPLLKSFVFARVKEDQRTMIRLTEGVVNFVYHNGKPVVIKEKVMQGIKQFQETHPEIEVMEHDRKDGLNGHAIKQSERPKPAKLQIQTLNLVLIARSASPTFTEARTNKN